MRIDLDLNELLDYFERHYTYSAYRWETLPAYDVGSDGGDVARYLRGEPEPDVELTAGWRQVLRDEKAAGKWRHRVRLLHAPITPYERYECEWGYLPNAACGEDIRVLSPGEHHIPSGLPDHDFWLLDEMHPVTMRYSATGEFEGATVEPGLLGEYRVAREQALACAVRFEGWWARHPELHRDQFRKAA